MENILKLSYESTFQKKLYLRGVRSSLDDRTRQEFSAKRWLWIDLWLGWKNLIDLSDR